MSALKNFTILILLCFFHGPLLFGQSEKTIAFNSESWAIEAAGSMTYTYMGENSLLINRGRAYLKDAKFLNGIIEFDIFLAERRAFPGVMFRMVDPSNYEEFYIRPHLSGKPDAFQYTPIYNGSSAWQLYHDQFTGDNDGLASWRPIEEGNGHNSVYHYPYDRWLHVKLVISNQSAEVYFDHSEEPVVHIHELKRDPEAGTIGIKSSVGPIHFANFSYTPIENPTLKINSETVGESEDNSIAEWLISDEFNEKELDGNDLLDKAFIEKRNWKKLKAEKSGVTNLAKVAQGSRENNTVFAKIVVKADQSGLKRLNLGYSDRVKVYCNGQALYSGDNGYRTRDYRFLGTMGYFDTIYLPLNKGNNEILIAVSETFGGWGVQGKFEDMEGIQLN
ncbi:hypothetical protein QQ008_20270 [Fulvivirgaceae bacterium BMA10]|uniref:Uncharacterized protein n=1 Tax=Splendidivirga corallicola TaxID=3051826 RepID=A0ABT8KSJ5_9BACT|nr:hypothetical protein [Fulvivirgaceae bacterium BMA10]